MEKLLAALVEKGINLGSDTKADVVKKVAKSIGLDPVDFVTRKVEVGPYTNKRNETNVFVKSSPYVVGRKANGRAETVRGLYCRMETIDDMIADLQRAKEIIVAGEVGTQVDTTDE